MPDSLGPKRGGSSRLQIATYNVLFKTSDAETRQDLSRLMKRNGVINLQEFDASHRDLFKWIDQKGWGHKSLRGGTQEPIIWDRRKYKLVDSGSRKLNDTVEHLPGRGLYPSHRATWVRLEDKKTGKVFTTVSVHTIAHNRGAHVTPRVDRISKHQFRELAQLTADLKKHGPVVIGGDLNAAPNRPATWPREILKHAHLRSNWSELGTGGVGKGGTHGKSFIDNFLTLTTMRDRLKLLSHRIVRGLHSDHNAVEADYRLK
ncbi:MAG: endonuclease/exonuclease/phosphatase family protein [Archangiaceae bacterium]|nr:endonuclease/exonuclease/phosphatase family protein [Archangiaceae bacterium]